MLLQFLGATGTVTGSRYLVERDDARVLVDCGLFQGTKKLRLRNREPFPVRPDSIDAVLLTHAHIDHSGYLPALVRDGFAGPIWCTPATADLCGILLPDAAWLQEEEARFANRHGYSKHHPALPLYTREDAERALSLIRTHPFDRPLDLPGGLRAQWGRAGHILGAAWIHMLAADGATLLFSGDLGRPEQSVVRAPAVPPPADRLVLESTYGDRRHTTEDPAQSLAALISATAARGGVVIVPAFAVGRTQALIRILAGLIAEGRIPRIPVFVDSPMARDVTELLQHHSGDHQLTRDELRAMREIATMTNSVEESKAVTARRGPMVIISASGMATGGRVLHHLKAFAPDRRNLILFSGYQAAGTRGAALANGADSVKIHGQYVPVHAEVRVLDGLSAHADYAEILDWLARFEGPPAHVYLTHGEEAAADALRRRIEERFGWKVTVPDYLEKSRFGSDG
jgi:metallo-beta-lactamase family protein